MTLKQTPGPSYVPATGPSAPAAEGVAHWFAPVPGVGPVNGQPVGGVYGSPAFGPAMYVPAQAPSPSKPKMSDPASVRLLRNPAELFWTPTRVSSEPSRGPCEESVLVVTDPFALTANSTEQLVSYPTVGH